ncbi:MAG: ATP-grasp domain-containing protein [bacterium]|nr:ATP-grasp domain-containing protein [bacterium]
MKLADRSYKFYSSRLEDSYLDMEAIIDKAIELEVDYIHPGYGFLAEEPDFAMLCKKNNIGFIGPDCEVLEIVKDKLRLKEIAAGLGIETLPFTGPLKSFLEFESVPNGLKYPAIIKPIKGSGGKGIKVVETKKEAREQLTKMLNREHFQQQGLFIEPYYPNGHHIELPFFRDVKGNLLLLPEIESSLQRRFQKIFQESPSVNVTDECRSSMYRDAQKLVEKINFVGLGYVEFIIADGMAYFLEINPSFQINSLIPEIHIISNFIKKQFALATGDVLYRKEGVQVDGVEIVKPQHAVMLVSLMAENSFDNFQPSSGTISEFYYYSTIRNLFKTHLYGGAKMSPIYDPYIGKIITFSSTRETTINDMKNFLGNIVIKGIKTNLPFFRHLLCSDSFVKGETIIDYVKLKCDFTSKSKSDEEINLAGALLSAAFHLENRKRNYKAKLETMKQPGFFKRLFNRI